MSERVKRLARVGVMAALSIVLVLLIHFPVIPAAPWLEYDAGDIPILIVTFLYGPWYGIGMTVIVSVIQGLTVSAGSTWVGIVMHILSTGAYCLVAGLIYRHKKTMKRALLALAVGAVVMVAVMAVCNLIFTPIFMGAALDEVIKMLLPIILPFNIFKAAVNGVLTFMVYKSVSRLFGTLDERADRRRDQA